MQDSGSGASDQKQGILDSVVVRAPWGSPSCGLLTLWTSLDSGPSVRHHTGYTTQATAHMHMHTRVHTRVHTCVALSAAVVGALF